MKQEKKQTRTSVLQKLTSIENLLKKKDDKPLNFKEACSYLGFAPSYLYKLTYRKVIPHYKPTGKMLFFSKCELDEWIFSKSKISAKGGVNQSEKLEEGREKSEVRSKNDEEEEDDEPP